MSYKTLIFNNKSYDDFSDYIHGNYCFIIHNESVYVFRAKYTNQNITHDNVLHNLCLDNNDDYKFYIHMFDVIKFTLQSNDNDNDNVNKNILRDVIPSIILYELDINMVKRKCFTRMKEHIHRIPLTKELIPNIDINIYAYSEYTRYDVLDEVCDLLEKYQIKLIAFHNRRDEIHCMFHIYKLYTDPMSKMLIYKSKNIGK